MHFDSKNPPKTGTKIMKNVSITKPQTSSFTVMARPLNQRCDGVESLLCSTAKWVVARFWVQPNSQFESDVVVVPCHNVSLANHALAHLNHALAIDSMKASY